MLITASVGYQSTGAPKRTEQNSFVRIGKSQDEDSIIIKDYSNALEVLSVA